MVTNNLYQLTGDIKDINKLIVDKPVIDQMQAKINSLMLEFCPEEIVKLIVDKSVIDQMQAQIDSLMLEFCPEEMSEEQRVNWGKHQRRSAEPIVL